VSPDEVTFGTPSVVPPGLSIDEYTGTIENPKDGQFIITATGSTAGASQVYDQGNDFFIDVADPVASASADAAADAAALAQLAADNAQDAADAADDAAALAAASASSAFSAAQQAQIDAGAAQTSANGKNAVFRQSTTPTATKIGDIWFHQDDPGGNVGGKGGDTPKRWNGTSWVSFGLNYLAVTSLDAGDIVTGTLEAITVRTSLLGERRIELSNQDDILFYKSNAQIGVITGINTGWSGGESDGSYSVNEGVLIAAGASSPSQGGPAFPSLVVSGGSGNIGAYVFGDSNTYLAAETGSVYTVGEGFTSYADVISLACGDSAGWYVEVGGPLVLTGVETVVQSSTPPTAAPTSGQSGTIRFHYT
jgi:hypothetical protein